ncbi:hypothetical protein GCM10007931_18240 [Vibrio algivorus]|uniref:PilZ domain-containing protein n=1 Tax=Vibrio algivorus TaxID=1667024 RepID=A0ABQ6EPF2_9VIBR|nr:hypothetical protein GCM10007931_18240 [Vibrio algivorus]
MTNNSFNGNNYLSNIVGEFIIINNDREFVEKLTKIMISSVCCLFDDFSIETFMLKDVSIGGF